MHRLFLNYTHPKKPPPLRCHPFIHPRKYIQRNHIFQTDRSDSILNPPSPYSLKGLRSHVSSSSSPAPHGNNRAAVHARDSSARIMLPAVLHRSLPRSPLLVFARPRHPLPRSPRRGPLPRCSRSPSLIGRTEHSRNRGTSASGRWRSCSGRACAPVEIRWRPSVCTGRDQAAAERSRSCGGQASVSVEIRRRPSGCAGGDQATALVGRCVQLAGCVGKQVQPSMPHSRGRWQLSNTPTPSSRSSSHRALAVRPLHLDPACSCAAARLARCRDKEGRTRRRHKLTIRLGPAVCLSVMSEITRASYQICTAIGKLSSLYYWCLVGSYVWNNQSKLLSL